jgi:excisionase family DNA binding protein
MKRLNVLTDVDVREVLERPVRLLYTYAEAGACLMVSERQIQTMVAAGELPSVAIGRLRRIAYEDLAAFVDSLRANGDNQDHKRRRKADR